MFYIYRKIFKSINSNSRQRYFYAVFIGIISTLFDFVSIGAIVPFLFVTLLPDQLPPNILIWREKFLEVFSFTGFDEKLLFLTFFIVLTVLSFTVRSLTLVVINSVGYSIASELTSSNFNSLMSKNIQFFGRNRSSDLLSNITQKSFIVATQVILPSIGFIIGLIFMIIFCVMLGYLVPVGFLLSLCFIIFFYGLSVLMTKERIGKLSREIDHRSNTTLQLASACLGGIRDIKLSSSEDLVQKRFNLEDQRLKKALAVAQVLAALPRLFIEGMIIIAISISIVALDKLSINLLEVIPYVAALALSTQRLLPIFQQTYYNYTMISGGKETFLSLIKNFEEHKNLTEDTQRVQFENAIELTKISFRHDENIENHVFKNASLKIEQGDKVMLAGPSGSGKSTLCDIIMGLIQPTTGDIFVDGNKLPIYKMPAWRKKFSHVAQEVFIYDGTIVENVCVESAMTVADINEERLRKALKFSHLEEFIETSPDGIYTRLTENGKNLSGGQKQRIGIARAIYKGSEFLVLDEITSSLDKVTADEIMKSVINLPHQYTVICISHNLEYARYFDKTVHIESKKLKLI